MEVWKTFKGVFKEKVIQRALERELKDSGLRVEGQKKINIHYKGEIMGIYVPDFVVDDKILIEIKVKPYLTHEDERQFWHCLRGSDYKLGFLINFGSQELEIKRRIYDKAREKYNSISVNQRTHQRKSVSINGVASLPVIMGLTLLILAVGISITALGFTESFIVAGQKQSSEALFYAEAGARDALMKIIRNKNYSELSGYQIAFVSDGCTSNDGCATITVDSDDGSALTPKTVDSEGRVKNNVRKIRVEVIFDDSSNGEIKNANWTEITD